MKKPIIAATIPLASATPAYALSSFLVAQWYDNGNYFCRYDNGAVMNVGYRLCPLKIKV